MLDNLFINLQTITLFDVIVNIGLSFIIGFFISIIYRITYVGYSYSSSFINALVILSMITAIVIMVIGNNLARAFGLVGAMSIIRFRTVIKDTRDIVFVFFALAGGMASGSGNYLIGVVGSFVVGLVVLSLFIVNFGSVRRKDMLLRFFMIPNDTDENIYLPVFQKYLKNFALLNIKSVRMGQFLELSFHIQLKNIKQYSRFINEMNGLEGLERISLIFNGNEEENMG